MATTVFNLGGGKLKYAKTISESCGQLGALKITIDDDYKYVIVMATQQTAGSGDIINSIESGIGAKITIDDDKYTIGHSGGWDTTGIAVFVNVKKGAVINCGYCGYGNGMQGRAVCFN